MWSMLKRFVVLSQIFASHLGQQSVAIIVQNEKSLHRVQGGFLQQQTEIIANIAALLSHLRETSRIRRTLFSRTPQLHSQAVLLHLAVCAISF